ncbi:MAG: hypothetical protein GY805_08530 [Chloroflexi bacterium]|nr:hypothetical protein [Chloroflexota bacterium]
MRLWQDGEQQPWWVLLENPHTREQCGFASLEQAFAYLEEQTTFDYDKLDQQNQNIIP